LFGARGECVGMLDVTGIATQERPELRRLVTHSARAIENALVLAHPHALLLRMNWPGSPIGLDDDALVCLDADGQVVAANAAAREMNPALASRRPGALPHCGELFAMPWEQLYDNARAQRLLEAPLWSGLTAQVLASRAGAAPHETVAAPAVALKEVEVDLIRKAVREARGNVMEAARRLGISRATIYRRLRQ
jgi:transcriptional regulator of acetoin/glycerol metabolism